MLKKWFVTAALLMCVSSFALEGKLFFTLAPNVADEFAHIMPFRPPHIPNVTRCVRNQPVELILVLAKPAVGKNGEVLVEVESAVATEPGGKTTELVEAGKPRAALQGVKKNARDFSGVMLANFGMRMIVEDTDPLGKTRICLRLRDRGDDSVLELAAEIDAVETLPDAPEKPMSTEEMSKFITEYYQSPDPAKIQATFAAFLRFDEENSGKKRAYDPLMWLCAFAELCKLNPQLRPALAKGAADYSDIHKKYVAMILAEAGAEEVELKDADPELQALFAKVRGKKPLSFEVVIHPAQLDALWTQFFVTGRVEPIRRLVGELRKRDNVMTLDEAKKLGRKPNADEMKKIMNGLVGRAAEWSLAANAKQHKLVGYYLEAMLIRQEFPDPDAAIKLGGMLINAGLMEVVDKPDGGKGLRSVLKPPAGKSEPGGNGNSTPLGNEK
jgi:hypothetical protein